MQDENAAYQGKLVSADKGGMIAAGRQRRSSESSLHKAAAHTGRYSVSVRLQQDHLVQIQTKFLGGVGDGVAGEQY